MAYSKWDKAEDMMPGEEAFAAKRGQLPNGHMSEPIKKQHIAYSVWHMAKGIWRKAGYPRDGLSSVSEDQTSRGVPAGAHKI